jgi:hypothetical protein
MRLAFVALSLTSLALPAAAGAHTPPTTTGIGIVPAWTFTLAPAADHDEAMGTDPVRSRLRSATPGVVSTLVAASTPASASTLGSSGSSTGNGGVFVEDRRPALLPPLYVTFATLQVLDIHFTRQSLSRGAVERNAAMARVVENLPALIAVKAAVTTSTILVGEKLWKRNRIAAVALMIGLNAGYAVVAAHNYRVASR